MLQRWRPTGAGSIDIVRPGSGEEATASVLRALAAIHPPAEAGATTEL